MPWISLAFNFLKGNTAFYIALAIAGVIIVGLWLRLDTQNARLEKAESDLNISLEANHKLFISLNAMKLEHARQIEAISGANAEKEQIRERVEYVNRYIYKKYESGEDNLTKLFNSMVERLWSEQNASSERSGASEG